MSDDGANTRDSGDASPVRVPGLGLCVAESPSVQQQALDAIVAKWNREAAELTARSTNSEEYGEIVLWHRWVDANLEAAIRSAFVPDTKTIADGMFKHPGALSSFSGRAHMGRCLGLFGPITYTDLKVLNGIRNEFAHPRDSDSGQLEIYGFDHPQIARQCEKLQFLQNCWFTKHSPVPTTNRERFQLTAKQIAVCLWSRHVVPTAFTSTQLRISVEHLDTRPTLP